MFFQAEDIRGNGLVSKSLTEISQSFTQQQAVSVKHCTGNSVLPQRAIILHRASANPFHRKQCSPVHLQTMIGTPDCGNYVLEGYLCGKQPSQENLFESYKKTLFTFSLLKHQSLVCVLSLTPMPSRVTAL